MTTSFAKIFSTALILFFSSTLLFAQTKNEKKVKAKDVSTGMYNSTQSKAALAYYDQAAALHTQEKYKKAIDLYKKAIKEDTSFVEAYDNIAVCYRRLGDFDNAIKYYKKSIQLYPEGTMAHMNLGLIYGIQKEYDKALAEYEIMQKLNPDDAEGYYGTITIYIAKKDYKSAIKAATKTLEIYEATNNPYISDAQYFLGLSYYYDGDMKNAKIYFEQAKKSGVKLPEQLVKELDIK